MIATWGKLRALGATALLVLAAERADAQPTGAPGIPGGFQPPLGIPEAPPAFAIPPAPPGASAPTNPTFAVQPGGSPMSATPAVGAPAVAAPGAGAAPGMAADPMAALDAVRAQPASSGPGADGTPLNDVWRAGLRFESADKAFSIFVGGRAQMDVVTYAASGALRNAIPGNNPLEDGVNFRRVRLDMGGTLYKNFEYYAQVDFVNGFQTSVADNRQTIVPAPTDMWVQYKDLPWTGATVRVGNQKMLYSFEHLTSSRFLNFIERSVGFDAFAENQNNGFEPGITVLNTYAEKRGTWGVGLFKNTRSAFGYNVGRDETEVNGRVTFLPVYEEEGKYLVHVGVGSYTRDLDQDQARLRSRFDARNSPSAFAPLVADTGNFFGSRQYGIIPEFVVVAGPWSFQSEYYASWVNQTRGVGANNTPLADQGTTFFQSAYAEVHYFLTGESRAYSRDSATFGRVVPKKNFGWDKCGFTGWGAWQLTARYSYLNLNSKGIRGGEVNDMTLGLNWFQNPNMKMQFNYFLTDRRVDTAAGTGTIHGFAMRTAIDF